MGSGAGRAAADATIITGRLIFGPLGLAQFSGTTSNPQRAFFSELGTAGDEAGHSRGTNRADPDMPFPGPAGVAEAGPANNPERRATPVTAQSRFPRIPTFPPYALPPPSGNAARLNR